MNHRIALTSAFAALSLVACTALAQMPQSGTPLSAPAATQVFSPSEAHSSASTGVTSILSAAPEDFAKLKISPGFLLQVEVFDIPELSTEVRVGETGDIVLPLAGPVHVGGDTLAEAQMAIETKLISGQIVNHPQVTLNVRQYAPFVVAVLGEVQNPGRIQLLAPHSLLDLISQVGGETAIAGNKVEVRHTANGVVTTQDYPYSKNSDGASIADVIVHEGDTVIVPRTGIVYVLGAVNRPGGYIMQEDGKLDAEQALALAGGTALQAKIGALRIVRRNPDGTLTEIPVDYNGIAQGKVKAPALQAEDILYIPISKIKAVFTTGSSLIGEAATATVYAVR